MRGNRVGQVCGSRVVPVVLMLVVLAGCQAGTADPDVAPGGGEPVLEPSEPFGLAGVTLRGPEGDEVAMPVYVADEPEQRARGLMDRDDLPREAGMVFLFEQDSEGSFYMYRTRIPLSIAFFAADGEVLAVLDMDPCESEDAAACERYNPGVAYRGALEVNQGYFDDIGLVPGWTIDTSNVPQEHAEQ